MTRRQSRRWRRSAAVGVAASLVVLASTTSWPMGRPARAATPPAELALSGQVTEDVLAETTPWANGMLAETGTCSVPASALTAGCVNVTMDASSGDLNARQALAAGGPGAPDFIISGVPFQTGELPAGKSVISAPVMSSGLAFLFNPTVPGFQISDGSGATTDTYGPQDGNVVPYVAGRSNCTAPPNTPDWCAPLEVPADNLAAMLDEDTAKGPDGQPLNFWGSVDIAGLWSELGQLGPHGYDPAAGDTFSPDATAEPTSYVPVVADADSWYLQSWFAGLVADTKNPGNLTGGQQLQASEHVQSTEWPLTTVSENPPALRASSVNDLSQLVNSAWFQVGNGQGGTTNAGGALSYTPPSGAALVYQAEANDYLTSGKKTANWAMPESLSLQNANGDWVAPTPASIFAGVAAGDSGNACSSQNQNAMYATTHAVPGAYPITWVDCLYAPTKGLSIDKADAIAGLIRYLVTDGQNVLGPLGDAGIPTVYIDQAKAAANLVVTDNCAAAGGRVVLTATPTTYSPTSPGVLALGPQDECEPIPSSSSPTTTSPGKTAPSGTSVPTPRTTAPNSGSQATSTTLALGSNGSAGGDSGTGSGALGFPASAFGTPGGNGSSSLSGSELGSALAASALGPGNGTSTPAPGPTRSPTSPIQAATPQSKLRSSSLAAAIASNLPIPLGGAGQTIDKLSALLIGGLLFLGARRLARRVSKAWRA